MFRLGSKHEIAGVSQLLNVAWDRTPHVTICSVSVLGEKLENIWLFYNTNFKCPN